MGDVLCASCREPWDTYHLKFDGIHEFASFEDIEVWEDALREGSNPLDIKSLEPTTGEEYGKLFRRMFEANGWKFGGTIFSVLECPACTSASSNMDGRELEMLYYAVEDALGNDMDATQVEMEDLT